ncbi:MAG: hypothetical protein KAW91_03180, partial [candidate division Zixibacteria bacterium]|nr:hypothetical protein [candidate division Zixibacteria bacterium]
MVPLVLYYLTLGALVALAFFPDRRFWGINWWGYYPIWVVLVLAALGAVSPLILRLFEHRWDSPPDDGGTAGGNLRF